MISKKTELEQWSCGVDEPPQLSQSSKSLVTPNLKSKEATHVATGMKRRPSSIVLLLPPLMHDECMERVLGYWIPS
jgi:hypothetical protein